MLKELSELNYSKKELAEIWNNLNCWKWDNRIGDKPENWDTIPDFHLNKTYTLPTKSKIIKKYTRYIMSKIGEKECLRYHHINNIGRTNTAFEIWWLKSKIQKLLGIGFYSKKSEKQIVNILSEIAQENQNEYVKKTFEK